MFAYDAEHLLDDKTIVIGLDEVGRGCFAGPVVTAAFAYDLSMLVNLAENAVLQKLNDSKKLSVVERNKIVTELKQLNNIYYSLYLR